MSKPLSVAGLLDLIGNDRVAVQYLDECVTDINWSVGQGTIITFHSDVAVTLEGTKRLGIVVWLDRADVADALAKHREVS